MDIIYEISQATFGTKANDHGYRQRDGISRPTVRKHLNTVEEPQYERVQPASPKLGKFEAQLTKWLTMKPSYHAPAAAPPIVYLRACKKSATAAPMTACSASLNAGNPQPWPKLTEAFVPLLFQPADACQFDWSQEQVELGAYCRALKWRTSAWPIAARCLSWPIRENAGNGAGCP